jgi:hypothetical protein
LTFWDQTHCLTINGSQIDYPVLFCPLNDYLTSVWVHPYYLVWVHPYHELINREIHHFQGGTYQIDRRTEQRATLGSRSEKRHLLSDKPFEYSNDISKSLERQTSLWSSTKLLLPWCHFGWASFHFRSVSLSFTIFTWSQWEHRMTVMYTGEHINTDFRNQCTLKLCCFM